jgi:2-amino-4-hydroxy-6-hydroxymethyldihydropteridine diphosphokinase
MVSAAYIGIGSNVGDKLGYCQKAVSYLNAPDIVITAISSLYETAPTDYLDQDWFYNAVVAVATTRSPYLLLTRCREIELQLDKKIEISKGPRTIDLDILFYQDVVMDAPDLIVPHPAALQRRFVLIPMAEIAPNFIPPNDSRTMSMIVKEVGESPVVQRKCGIEWAITVPR